MDQQKLQILLRNAIIQKEIIVSACACSVSHVHVLLTVLITKVTFIGQVQIQIYSLKLNFWT